MPGKAITTDEEAKKYKKEEELQRGLELSDMRHVLSSPQGIRVFKRLIEKGGLFRVEFTGNAKVHFNEGMRSFSLWVFSEAVAALESQIDMRDKIADIILNKKEVDERHERRK